MTRASSLPAVERREIPLLFPQSALSPLRLYIVAMLASFHCCRNFPDVHAVVMTRCRRCRRFKPPCLRSSAGMPSGPEALLFFSPFTALHTSSNDGRVSRFARIGSCGSFSRMEGSVGLTQFRSSLRCSAQRERMSLRSLNRVLPSFDRTGWTEWCDGP